MCDEDSSSCEFRASDKIRCGAVNLMSLFDMLYFKFSGRLLALPLLAGTHESAYLQYRKLFVLSADLRPR